MRRKWIAHARSVFQRASNNVSSGGARFFPKLDFRSIRAGSARLHVVRHPPVHVREYYQYCQGGLLEALTYSGSRDSVWLVFPHQAHIPPDGAIIICLQLEHTLVAPGGRDLGNSPLGGVPLRSGDGTYHVRLEGDAKPYARADHIIEYSVPNLVNVSQSELANLYEDKAEYLAPLLAEESPRGLRERPSVFTMHGGPTAGRRGVALERMNTLGIAPTNIQDAWGDYASVFADVAILVNVHQTDEHHTLEELRVLPAVMQGVLVVTEAVPLLDKVPYGDFLISASFDELAETVLDVLLHYEEYWALKFADGRFDNVKRLLLDGNRRSFDSLIRRTR